MQGGKGVEAEEEVIKALLRDFPSLLKELGGISDVTERYAYFIAWLNDAVERGSLGYLVVTGGFAVEVYTGRIYRTMDVDLICSNSRVSRAIERFLASVGEAIGRGYLLEGDLSLKSVDIVADYYDRGVPPVKVWVRGKALYLDPPEYLIVAYLAGWKYWGSSEDRDKALWLLAATKDVIDEDLLTHLAVRGKVKDALTEVFKLVEKVLSRPRREGREGTGLSGNSL